MGSRNRDEHEQDRKGAVERGHHAGRMPLREFFCISPETTAPPVNDPGGDSGCGAPRCGGNYPMGMKIFRPVRLPAAASVLRSMKSLADDLPSPEVMAVWP